MSKVLYVLKRHGEVDAADTDRLDLVAERLVPDNLAAERVVHDKRIAGQLAILIVNDRGSFTRVGNSLLCGRALTRGNAWSRPGGPLPSGDYALFREAPACLELATNSVGSRTLWYYLDDHYFLAATSQRAIVLFLGDFRFDPDVVPWMLSSGSLGPALAWDSRIHRLPASARLCLDRRRWTTTLHCETPAFQAEGDRQWLKRRLSERIEASVTSLTEDLDGWTLPLSGGYDSRAILCYLARTTPDVGQIRTLTWGVQSERERSGGDARVAARLADTMGVGHRFQTTDIAREPVSGILDRFLLCSEGRIDHLAAYADGMAIWRQLHDEGVKGIIRGDEGFGWIPVTSPASVRLRTGCAMCRDFENLAVLQDRYGLPEQRFPEGLERHGNESLEAWRDRLYHSFRMPTVLAALSDVKLSYIEQVNPLVYDDIIAIVRQIPDALRENKALFREIVDDIGPDVPYAVTGANAPVTELLANPGIVDHIRITLQEARDDGVLPGALIDHLLDGIQGKGATSGRQARLIRFIKRRVPSHFKSRLRDTLVKPRVDPYVLAFRAYILVRMNVLLNQDAQAASALP